jgi:hypothetical protein
MRGCPTARHPRSRATSWNSASFSGILEPVVRRRTWQEDCYSKARYGMRTMIVRSVTGPAAAVVALAVLATLALCLAHGDEASHDLCVLFAVTTFALPLAPSLTPIGVWFVPARRWAIEGPELLTPPPEA